MQSKVQHNTDSRKPYGRFLRVAIVLLILALVAIVLPLAALWRNTPAAILRPRADHYHFRWLLAVEGELVDFSTGNFQMPTGGDTCSAALATEPFHFHDGVGQWVHVHWADLTGESLLKYYGWDFGGELPGLLGMRIDLLEQFQWPVVATSAAQLPQPRPTVNNLYIYIVPFGGRAERVLTNQFRLSELADTFAGVASSQGLPTAGAEREQLPGFLKTVRAHTNTVNQTKSLPLSAARSRDLPQLPAGFETPGDILMFVQPDEPSAAQIQQQLQKVVAIPDSGCSG